MSVVALFVHSNIKEIVMILVKDVWTDVTALISKATILQSIGNGSVDIVESVVAPASVAEEQEALSLSSGVFINYKPPTAPNKTWARGTGSSSNLARGYN